MLSISLENVQRLFELVFLYLFKASWLVAKTLPYLKRLWTHCLYQKVHHLILTWSSCFCQPRIFSVFEAELLSCDQSIDQDKLLLDFYYKIISGITWRLIGDWDTFNNLLTLDIVYSVIFQRAILNNVISITFHLNNRCLDILFLY